MTSLVKIRVDLILKSGRAVCFYCDKITTRLRDGNDLSEISTEKQVGWPLYIRLDDVSAIVTRKVPFWCAWGAPQ